MTMLERLSALQRNVLRLEDHLHQDPAWCCDASSLADFLHETWPEATLCACQVSHTIPRRIVVLDAAGRPKEPIRRELDRLPGPDLVHSWTHYLAGIGKAACTSSEGTMLAIVLDDKANEEDERVAQLGLSTLSRVLSLHQVRRRMNNLEDEIEALERWANVGELSGILAHELTDFLNMLLLHVAVLEHRLPESERADLAEIRRHGNRAAELINHFQQYRRASPPGTRTVDLAKIVQEVAHRLSKTHGAALPLTLHLEQEVNVEVCGSGADVRRLVQFLMSNAVRAVAEVGGEVSVTTAANRNHARLRVEDTAPVPPATDIAAFFSSLAHQRDGVDDLELAACGSLARRLRIGLQASRRAEGGLSMVVDFGSDSGK